MRLVLALLLLVLPAAALAEPLAVKVGVLRETHSRETLSILDIPADDDTLAGALLGAADNNTTGKFTNQTFEAVDEKLDDGDDVVAAVDALVDKARRLIIADLSADAPAARRRRAEGAGRAALQHLRARRAAARGRAAAPMSFMSRRRARCWPTGSRNISSGSNGAAGC